MVIVTYYLVSSSCVSFVHDWQHNTIVLWHTDIKHMIREQRGYAAEIMNGRYMSQKLDNT
jgi:hypothetical protein